MVNISPELKLIKAVGGLLFDYFRRLPAGCTVHFSSALSMASLHSLATACGLIVGHSFGTKDPKWKDTFNELKALSKVSSSLSIITDILNNKSGPGSSIFIFLVNQEAANPTLQRED